MLDALTSDTCPRCGKRSVTVLEHADFATDRFRLRHGLTASPPFPNAARRRSGIAGALAVREAWNWLASIHEEAVSA